MKTLDSNQTKNITTPPLAPQASDGNGRWFNSFRSEGWGWLPLLCLLGACGLLTVSVGYALARNGTSWGSSLFWIGLLIMFVPVGFRLLSADASRQERIGLVVGLGTALYLVKVVHSPTSFTFHDEFVHWRTVQDIVQTHHLFSFNPVIPVSPLYPGLHIITSALMNLAGLDAFTSGLIVLGIARVIIVLALYLLFEEVSLSPRVAGIATLVYMANTNFVFFSAQFAYESLALPFAVLGLLAVARRARKYQPNRLGLNIVMVLSLLATVITHHLTTYAVVVFLGLWTLVAFGMNVVHRFHQNHAGEKLNIVKLGRATLDQFLPVRVSKASDGATLAKKWDYYSPAGAMLMMLVTSLTWLMYVANFTVGYLAPVIEGALIEIVQIIAGESKGRQLFKAASGQEAALWEQLVGYGSVLLIVFGLPFGLYVIWKMYRTNIFTLLLGIVALLYPASLLLRYTVSGWEISNRTSEFVFIAVAFVLSLGVTNWLFSKPRSWIWSVVFIGVASIMFLGGIILGWPAPDRVPGPYMVSADTRSIEAEGIDAAKWANTNLGPNNRMAADRINGLLMLAYGEQHTVMNVGDGVNVGGIYLSPTVGKYQTQLLQKGKIRYLVVDRRLSTALPLVGIYFENGEPGSENRTTPISAADLAKFDKLPNVNRLFDSGDIIVYDVGELSGVR